MELALVLDHDCNLRCRYCYAGQKSRRPMGQDVIARALGLALDRDPAWLSVTLFGGEPLLARAMFPAIEQLARDAIRARGLPITPRWLLNTNAMLLDPPTLDWLGAQSSAHVFVSLDGPAHVHDRLRVDREGGGSHVRVVTGIERLRARNIGFDLLAVVDPSNVGDLPETLEHLLSFGADRVALQPNFAAEWTDQALDGLAAHVHAAADVWARGFAAGRASIVEPFHKKVLSHLAGGRACSARCQLVRQEFAVAPSGRIYPCAQMVGEDDNAWSVGDVFAGIDLARVVSMRGRASVERMECAACALANRCENDCACRQIAATGALGGVSGVVCEWEAAVIGAVDRVAGDLFAKKAPHFLEQYYERRWVLAPGAVQGQRGPHVVGLRGPHPAQGPTCGPLETPQPGPPPDPVGDIAKPLSWGKPPDPRESP